MATKKPKAPKKVQYIQQEKAPKLSSRVTYKDKSMASLSSQFGFKTDKAWFDDLAKKQADIVKGAVTAEQVKTQRGLNQANALIDSDYFQQGLKSAQGTADRGLNAGMATEQNTRLAMGRQAALGGAYADAQGQMFQLGQQKIAADKQANIDAMTTWQDAVWKGADFTQRYNQDQYGRTEDTNNWNMQRYESARDQYNQNRDFNYQKVHDQNSWNMDTYKTNLGQYNEDRSYNRGVYESDRGYKRGVLESDRTFKQGQYEFNKNYGLDSGKLQLDKDRFSWEKTQAGKAGGSYGGGGGRGYSSGRSSSGGSSGGGGGGGTSSVSTRGTGTLVNMNKQYAAEKASTGAKRGTQILIDNSKSILNTKRTQYDTKKSLGITAPHLTGSITTSKNKYANLAKGRLW